MTGLTARQRAAIVALMTHPTIVAAADACGVHESTLHRWLGDATFCAELQAAQARAMDGVIRALATASAAAVDVLIDKMTDGMPGDQIRAAALVLANAPKWRETGELERRIAALEGQNDER